MYRSECQKYGEEFTDAFSKLNVTKCGAGKDIFNILAQHCPAEEGTISYQHLINRMCFWMATGSGKTLVLLKLIAHLHTLKKRKLIPPHRILLLAPSAIVLAQIKKTQREFSLHGDTKIELVELTKLGKEASLQFGNVETVYYWRSDNIREEQSDAIINYRRYLNGGNWYVFLDEAHKGKKGDSKRQAYYALMSNKGFMFNFSATFTESQDIITTAVDFNLNQFIRAEYGKHLLLGKDSFPATVTEPVAGAINAQTKEKVLLKSLITLAFVKLNYLRLKEKTGQEKIYHIPLMMTLVHSVGTEVGKNDLLNFFTLLRKFCRRDINPNRFNQVKEELLHEWETAEFLFEKSKPHFGRNRGARELMRSMTISDFRSAVFLAPGKGEIEVRNPHNGKEIAFQLRTADSPFALIRIGDITKWTNQFLVDMGIPEGKTLTVSYFENMEEFEGSILMGSRAFFESWDSNRPNVINFINIAKQGARKFTTQAIGRGVRIEPLKGHRYRLDRFSNSQSEASSLIRHKEYTEPLETLFIYATDTNAVQGILEGIQIEQKAQFLPLSQDLVAQMNTPKLKDGSMMPVLVPYYKRPRMEHHQDGRAGRVDTNHKFDISEESLKAYETYMKQVSDGFLATVRGMTAEKIHRLRSYTEASDATSGRFRIKEENSYEFLPVLEFAVLSHITLLPRQVKEISDIQTKEDAAEGNIIHFRKIEVSLPPAEKKELEEKMRKARKGRYQDMRELLGKYNRNEISEEEYLEQSGDRQNLENYNFRDEIKILPNPDRRYDFLNKHYYLPILINKKDNRLSYIRHIIQEKSEHEFIEKLSTWLLGRELQWDAWMFSKLDEHLDSIYIPYTSGNQERQFHPDFIFWMCRKNECRIVFVDPKGTEHTLGERKIDGYKKLFLKPETKNTKRFAYTGDRKWSVEVKLFMFSESDGATNEYKEYWIDNPEPIFA